MLMHPIEQQLEALRLRGMGRAYEHQRRLPDAAQMSFDERLALLLDAEHLDRTNFRVAQRLRWAKLPQRASMEDLDIRTPRGLDRRKLAQLTQLTWLDERLNLLITGPTGIGKSYLACALGELACRADRSVRYFRIARLHDELVRAGAVQKKSLLFRSLANAALLIIDDFGLVPLPESSQRDLLEILDDRYTKGATIVTSQLGVAHWHGQFVDGTLADAILDRLVHNAHKVELKGESLRKQRGALLMAKSD